MPAFARSMLEAVSMEPNLPASGRADKLAPSRSASRRRGAPG